MTDLEVPAATPRQIAEKADALFIQRQVVEMHKDAYEREKERLDGMEAELFDLIENAGLTSIRTGMGLFTLNDLAWPRIEDKAAALAWAEANAPEYLTLNHQALITPVREAIREGRDLPPGISFTASRKIRVTANKKAVEP